MKAVRYYRVMEKIKFIEVYDLDNGELCFNVGEEYSGNGKNVFDISLSYDDVKGLINDLKNLINDEG